MKLPTTAIQKCRLRPSGPGALPVASGSSAYTPPQIAKLTKPYMVRCEWTTVKLVSCHTSCSERNASKVPWIEPTTQPITPTKMNISGEECTNSGNRPHIYRLKFRLAPHNVKEPATVKTH